MDQRNRSRIEKFNKIRNCIRGRDVTEVHSQPRHRYFFCSEFGCGPPAIQSSNWTVWTVGMPAFDN